MSRLGRDAWYGQLVRFGALGAVNTLITSLLFYGLLYAVPAPVAFTVAYLTGLVFVAATTPRIAFGVSASTRQRGALIGCYLAVYLCGLGVATAAREVAHLSKAEIVIVTLLFTAPLNFLGSRFVLQRP